MSTPNRTEEESERLEELRRRGDTDTPVASIENYTEVLGPDLARRLPGRDETVFLVHESRVLEDGSIDDRYYVKLDEEAFLNLGGELNSLRSEEGAE